MLRVRAQPKLRELLQRLERALADVPVRVHGLHALAQRLRDEVQAELGRLLPWIDDVVCERLREEVDKVVDLAQALQPLFREADTLSEEVRQFAGRRSPAGEAHAPQRHERCQAWLAQIQHAPGAVTRVAHLADARRQLEDVRTALRLHGEAEHWLAEAAQLRDTLQDDPAAATALEDLPELWRQVLGGGASRAFVDALSERLRPLRERADRREVPPQQVHDADQSMAEIERWTHALEADGRDLEELRQRHDLVVREWHQRPPDELDALVSEAAALRRQRVEQARQERSRLLDEFERELLDVLHACGENAELRALVDALKSRRVEHPQHHVQWKARQREARIRLRAVAKNHERELETRLRERLERFTARLAELRAQPASEDGLREGQILALEVGRLRGQSEIDAILRALGELTQLERRLARLELHIDDETRAIDQRRQAQAARSARLQSALGLARLEDIVSLAELRAALELADAPTTLTAAGARQDEIEALLARLEDQCVAHCARLAREEETRIQALGAALRHAGVEPPPPPPGPAPAGTPTEAAEALLAVRAVQAATQNRVETALLALEEQQRQLEQRLSSLQPEELGPAEAATAEELSETHRRAEWARDHERSERLRRLATLLLRTRSFLTRLDHGRQAVRTRAAALRQRLKHFDEEHLRVFCPELGERVAGLIYGVPEAASQWRTAQAQLDEAERLLGRLERHARRLALAEAQGAARALRRTLRHATDASRRAADEALLGEWDACGAEDLPPLVLRLRLLERATLGTGGGVA